MNSLNQTSAVKMVTAVPQHDSGNHSQSEKQHSHAHLPLHHDTLSTPTNANATTPILHHHDRDILHSRQSNDNAHSNDNDNAKTHATVHEQEENPSDPTRPLHFQHHVSTTDDDECSSGLTSQYNFPENNANANLRQNVNSNENETSDQKVKSAIAIATVTVNTNAKRVVSVSESGVQRQVSASSSPFAEVEGHTGHSSAIGNLLGIHQSQTPLQAQEHKQMQTNAAESKSSNGAILQATSSSTLTNVQSDVNANANANVNANTKESIQVPTAHTHTLQNSETDNDADDMCPNVPLSFTVDVASALDHVLNELEQDKDEQLQQQANARANANADLHPSRISGGHMQLKLQRQLDHHNELKLQNGHGRIYSHENESGSGIRPCVLQQTSVMDHSSSGETSPSSGASLDGVAVGAGGISGNGNGTNGSDGNASAGAEEEKAAVSVESSMLVCEESLNMIAQMTAPPKQKQQQQQGNKVQAKAPQQSDADSQVQSQSQSQVKNMPLTTTANSLPAPGTTPIASNISLKILPVPASIPIAPSSMQIQMSTGKVAPEITKIKCVSENTGMAGTAPATPTVMRKGPLITGTAAAQFEAMNRKNGIFQSSPMAPSPKLIPGKVSITSSAAAERSEIINANAITNANANVATLKAEDGSDSDGDIAGYNGFDEKEVKRTEMGMDMLADIISHAAPISNVSGAATNAGEEGLCMVPIGQSLSVYTAIAAQAGVASHQPLPLPTVRSQTQPAQKQEYQPAQAHVPTQVHAHEQEQEQESLQSQPQSHTMDQPQLTQTYIREIGKIRRFCAATGEFSDWEDLPCQTYGDTEPRRWCELNIDESIEIPLRRGGRLRVFPNFVADGRRGRVSQSMDQCTLYRQYWRQGYEQSLEARVQVLLSSKTSTTHNGSSKDGAPGYLYDGVTMMAQPLEQVPEVERLGRDLAELYRLPGKEWNIGANLVCYRTGEDHMAWNSNCEQGEVLILCIITESQNCTRPILIRPKGHNPLQDGDEEIIVFVGQGDAYEMDGQMQLSYEHCMPKKEDDTSAKRSVVVFRHGRSVPVTVDTGYPLFTEQKQTDAPSVNFGHPIREIPEGKEVFIKQQLLDTGAHLHEKKNINGTSKEGCDSILVDNQDPLMREDDGLCWLQVTASKSDGGAALCLNFANKLPVRVFRSSTLVSQYAPSLYADEAEKVLYRYDGLYVVRAMWDTEGNETDVPPPNNASKHTFFLMRYPKKPVDGNFQEGMHYNKMSIHELWNEVQKRSGVRSPRLFQVLQPFMELAPIGDKANLSRRRKENIKLPSEENLKNRRARRRRRNAPSPEGSVGDSQRQLSSTRCLPMPKKKSLGNVSNSENEVDITHHSGDDSDTGNVRPTRKSATAARSYLQEAMQNKNGVVDKSNNRKRRPSIHIDDSSHPKRTKDVSHSDDDSSVDIKPTSSDSGQKAMETEQILLPPSDLVQTTPQEVEVTDDKKSISSRKPKVKVADPMEKPPAKRAYKRKQPLKPEAKKVTKKTNHGAKSAVFDPASIKVGYRVNVEYRDVLYKATVRRVRLKQEIYQYQIHYDGNKKTNLRWIPSTMVHSIISEVADEETEVYTKPVAKKQKEEVVEPVKVEEIVEVKEEIAVKKEMEEAPDVEDNTFVIGSEKYVEYRKVLYIATIRKTRLNRKRNREYLVHYGGFKKNSDRWVKEETLSEINDETTLRFNEQRGEALNEGPDFEVKKPARARRSGDMDDSSFSRAYDSEFGTRRTRGRSLEPTRPEESIDVPTLDMGEFDAGVEFLPGSCVFVVRKDALYLAKMVKRKKIGKGMEYLVHFDLSSPNHDTWVPISSVYEINPKTRRIFDGTADKRDNLNDEEEEDDHDEDDIAPVKEEEEWPDHVSHTSPIRASSRRNARKPAKFAQVGDAEKEEEKPAKKPERFKKGSKSKPPIVLKPVDMTDIDSGCNFLPGSTIFVEWKNGLYLGKMLKKRGKGDNMEYFVHYDGFRQSQDAWVSISMVYEINPQTKRAFNKQRKK